MFRNVIQSRPYVRSASRKSFVPAFFKVSIDHLFDNLESGKRNYCLGVLNLGSKNLSELRQTTISYLKNPGWLPNSRYTVINANVVYFATLLSLLKF